MREQLLQFLILFITIFSKFLYWAIFLYILMSWISRKKTPFNVWLQKLVVPVIRPFRFARIGMLDFSPILALLVIDFAGTILVRFISKYLET